MNKNTSIYALTPDFTPVARVMALQTKIAAETSQAMMQLALMPMRTMQASMGAFYAPAKAAVEATSSLTLVDTPKPVAKPAPKPKAKAKPAAKAKPVATEAPKPVAPVTKPAPVARKAEAPAAKPTPAAKPAPEPKPVAAKSVAPVAKDDVAPAAAKKAAAPVAKPAPATNKASAPAAKRASVSEKAMPDKVVSEPVSAKAADKAVDTAADAPVFFKAAKGKIDDLTRIKGVGPKLAETLNKSGIYHFTQIAAWTPKNAEWVDDNIAGVRGRASRDGWAAQAAKLAK